MLSANTTLNFPTTYISTQPPAENSLNILLDSLFVYPRTQWREDMKLDFSDMA